MDGEGTIRTHRYKGYFSYGSVSLAQSKPGLDALLEIQSFLADRGIKSNLFKRLSHTEGRRDMYALEVTDKPSFWKFIQCVQKHSVVKAGQIESVIAAQAEVEQLRKMHGHHFRMVLAGEDVSLVKSSNRKGKTKRS